MSLSRDIGLVDIGWEDVPIVVEVKHERWCAKPGCGVRVIPPGSFAVKLGGKFFHYPSCSVKVKRAKRRSRGNGS